MYLVAGFRRQEDEYFAPLGYYAAISYNFLQMIQDNPPVPSWFLTPADGTNGLSWSVGRKLPLHAP